MQHYLKQRRSQRGQALIEMGLVLPLLLVMMLAVGYFGHAMISLQNLNAAARSAAREMAVASTETPMRRLSGSYAPDAQEFLDSARSYLGQIPAEQLLTKPQTRLNHDYNAVLNLSGRFDRLSEHRFSYVLSETVDATSASYNSPTPEDRLGNAPANLQSLQFGIGALYYGGTLQYNLDELTPISRFIFRGQRDPVLRIGATSLMPAELPLRGSGYGLMNLNPWLNDLIGTDVTNNSDYPDLIDG